MARLEKVIKLEICNGTLHRGDDIETLAEQVGTFWMEFFNYKTSQMSAAILRSLKDLAASRQATISKSSIGSVDNHGGPRYGGSEGGETGMGQSMC